MLKALAILREKILYAREAIQHRLVALGAQQRLGLMLAVDLHQRGSDAREALHGHHLIVDQHARAAAFRNDAADHHLALRVRPGTSNMIRIALKESLERDLA